MGVCLHVCVLFHVKHMCTIQKTHKAPPPAASSSTPAASSASVSSGGGGAADGLPAVPKNRCSGNMSATVAQLRDELPSNAEVMVRVLADGPTWTKAKICCTLSHVVWQSHSAEYSGLKTAEDCLKYYKGCSWGTYLSRLSKAKQSK